MKRAVLLGLAAGLLVPGAARVARAEEGELDEEPGAPPEPDRPSAPAVPRDPNLPYLFEVGARSAYATAPIRGGVNPFGVGVGGRLGFNFSGFYAGASVMDYMGGSDVGATDQAWLLGVELGYTLRFGPHVSLRPFLGVGDAVVSHTEPTPAGRVDVVSSASSSGGGGSVGGAVVTSVNDVYLQPGLLLQLATTNYFLGVDAGALVLPAITYGPAPAQTTTWISYWAGAQLGFRL